MEETRRLFDDDLELPGVDAAEVPVERQDFALSEELVSDAAASTVIQDQQFAAADDARPVELSGDNRCM